MKNEFSIQKYKNYLFNKYEQTPKRSIRFKYQKINLKKSNLINSKLEFQDKLYNDLSVSTHATIGATKAGTDR